MLVRKEVHLYPLALVVAGIYALVWIAMRLTRMDAYIAGQSFQAISEFYGLFIAVWGLLGAQQRFAWPYFAGLGAAALIALWHYTLIRDRSREGCFRAFRLNHWVGFAAFAGTALAFAPA